MGRGTLTRAPIQELYDPTFESVASLDDLQRSWETLKNVVRDLSPFITVRFAGLSASTSSLVCRLTDQREAEVFV